MTTPELDQLKVTLTSSIKRLHYLQHACSHGCYFANLAFVGPSELAEMASASSLPFDNKLLVALSASVEHLLSYASTLSLHACRRLSLELQWWSKQRASPTYDAAKVEGHISFAGDANESVLLPLRPLQVHSALVLPQLPPQPSAAATCRVLDAAAHNAGLAIGDAPLEVLDLSGVQWAQQADTIMCLGHTYGVLARFLGHVEEGLHIAERCGATAGADAAAGGAEGAAHEQRMAAACASVRVFDAYVRDTLVQPSVRLMRAVASSKLQTGLGPLVGAPLWSSAPPPVENSAASKATAVLSDSSAAGGALSQSAEGDPDTSTNSTAPVSTALPSEAKQAKLGTGHAEQSKLGASSFVRDAFGGVAWQAMLPYEAEGSCLACSQADLED